MPLITTECGGHASSNVNLSEYVLQGLMQIPLRHTDWTQKPCVNNHGLYEPQLCQQKSTWIRL